MSTAAIVHFAGIWKNRGTQVVPHCCRFSMSPKYGQTTDDKTKVNCTRCAKQLGFEPVAKEVSSTKGTCQCCFGGFETRQKAGKGDFRSVLHGYTRPGHGYILGDCRGHGHVPFEVSCEQTKVFRGELVDMLAATETYLAKCQANEVESLTYEARTSERNPRTMARLTKMVTVLKGAVATDNPFWPAAYEKIPSFEQLMETEIWGVERRIKAITSDIAFLGEKIAGWVAVPFPKKA